MAPETQVDVNRENASSNLIKFPLFIAMGSYFMPRFLVVFLVVVFLVWGDMVWAIETDLVGLK